MAENLHDLGGRMRKFKPLLQRQQEAMDRQVQDTLDDYSGIIHTLPMLVKLHEEAMELFNSSKEKETVSYVGWLVSYAVVLTVDTNWLSTGIQLIGFVHG